MSEHLNNIVGWIGHIAPLSFLIAALSGLFGTLLSLFSIRAAVKRSELEIAKIRLALELIDRSEKVIEIDAARLRAQYRVLLESTAEATGSRRIPSRVLARLGEYLSNYSPVDSLTKDAGR